jgi:hypothetical protein
MPITAFTRAYQRVLRDLKKHGRPAVLTVDGKPGAVIMDAAAFDRLMDASRMDRALLEGTVDNRPPISISESRRRIAALAKAPRKPMPANRKTTRTTRLKVSHEVRTAP